MFPKNARSGASLAAAAILCCAALAARAGERYDLTTELQVEQDYDSNIFYTTNNPIGSAVTYLRPSLNLENHGTLGDMRLYGFVSEHIFWEESKLSGFDRGFGAELSRRILPRTEIFGSGSFVRLASNLPIYGPSTVTTAPGGPGIPGQPLVQPGELIKGAVPPLNLGQGTFGVRQQLTPRSKLELSGGPFSVDYLQGAGVQSTLRDYSGWFAGATLDYMLSPLDRAFVSLQATDTDFSDVTGRAFPVNDPLDPHSVNINTGNSTSAQQSLLVGWSRNWDELWNTSIAVGGRRLSTRTDNAMRPFTEVGISSSGIVPFVNYAPVSFSDVGPGWVGELSISRVLPRGQIALSYSRETRTTSSLTASNVDVDTVSLAFSHRLSSRLTFSLHGSYEHYESVNNNAQFFPAGYVANSFNPITGPEYSCLVGSLVTSGSGPSKTGQCQIASRSSLQTDVYYAEARFDWQLFRRLTTFVLARYDTRNGDVLLFGQNYDKYSAGIGFKYDYSLGL